MDFEKKENAEQSATENVEQQSEAQDSTDTQTNGNTEEEKEDKPVEIDPETEKKICEKVTYMAKKLNMTPSSILKSLVKQGFDQKASIQVMLKMQNGGTKFTSEGEKQNNETANKTIYGGVVCLALGIILTVISFAAASAVGGGKFKISIGLIVVGIVMIIKGLASKS